MNKRASGVLMHITSLPGDYGIGSFGQAAYDFVDLERKQNKLTGRSCHLLQQVMGTHLINHSLR